MSFNRSVTDKHIARHIFLRAEVARQLEFHRYRFSVADVVPHASNGM
jgi:hypothetical protein